MRSPDPQTWIPTTSHRLGVVGGEAASLPYEDVDGLTKHFGVGDFSSHVFVFLHHDSSFFVHDMLCPIVSDRYVFLSASNLAVTLDCSFSLQLWFG
jgi:hypothetical protein